MDEEFEIRLASAALQAQEKFQLTAEEAMQVADLYVVKYDRDI